MGQLDWTNLTYINYKELSQDTNHANQLQLTDIVNSTITKLCIKYPCSSENSYLPSLSQTPQIAWINGAAALRCLGAKGLVLTQSKNRTWAKITERLWLEYRHRYTSSSTGTIHLYGSSHACAVVREAESRERRYRRASKPNGEKLQTSKTLYPPYNVSTSPFLDFPFPVL